MILQDASPKEDGADVKLDANKDSKQDESVSQTDEKKEKVKKKRSFRSFSFLRREKKAKEENKNGDVAKEVNSCTSTIVLYNQVLDFAIIG